MIMTAIQDQGGQQPAARGRSASPARVIGGFALMFLGVALTSYGAHFLAKTGNCSGTGYTSYGPVPKCGGGEALYITSAFFVGPGVAIVGWLMAQAWGWLWPTFCIGVGVGLITIYKQTATAGAGAFGFLVGICLFALAGLSVIVTLRKRRRQRTVGEAAIPGTTVLASTPAPAQQAPVWERVATGDRSDPFDKIAKLAQLRDTGALTEAEFEIQKAKLLTEI
jgi:Short C-terminal domain